MANPNPSPATRFKPGNNGRPKEARDRISRAFLTALADDFEQHGVGAIVKVREEDTANYLRVAASVIPKEIEITRPLDGMDDSELAKAIELLADVLRAQAPIPETEKDEHVSRH
jgi:hypothetical protein